MKEKGLSLIEVIIYVALTTVIVMTAMQFFLYFQSAQNKNDIGLFVEQQGQQALERVSYLIRSADTVTTPALGATSSQLVVVASSTINTVSVATNTLQITRGSADPVNITSPDIRISDVVFRNRSHPTSTRSLIRVEFSLSQLSTTTELGEFIYERVFYASEQTSF